jgi:hypothetical protein
MLASWFRGVSLLKKSLAVFSCLRVLLIVMVRSFLDPEQSTAHGRPGRGVPHAALAYTSTSSATGSFEPDGAGDAATGRHLGVVPMLDAQAGVIPPGTGLPPFQEFARDSTHSRTGRRRRRSEASLDGSNPDISVTPELPAAIGLGPRKRP